MRVRVSPEERQLGGNADASSALNALNFRPWKQSGDRRGDLALRRVRAAEGRVWLSGDACSSWSGFIGSFIPVFELLF